MTADTREAAGQSATPCQLGRTRPAGAPGPRVATGSPGDLRRCGLRRREESRRGGGGRQSAAGRWRRRRAAERTEGGGEDGGRRRTDREGVEGPAVRILVQASADSDNWESTNERTSRGGTA